MTNEHSEPRLELTFLQLGDRQGHRISLVHHGECIPVLESVEGTAADPWPPSPPLQQIHEQTLAAGPVVWGLGAAGNGHWSASFSWQKTDESLSSRLCVELALRSSDSINNAGSTYHLLAPQTTLEMVSPTECLLTRKLSGHVPTRISITIDPAQAEFNWNLEQREISLRPRAVWKAKSPTVTWNYSIQICPISIK